MDVTVMGSGRWGTFIAWYLDGIGHNVTLCGRPGSASMQQLMRSGGNGMVQLGEGVALCTDAQQALDAARVVVVSVPSQALRGLMDSWRAMGVRDKLFVLCMKGLEVGSGLRLSEVVAQSAHESCRSAVWIGPGHPQEFLRGVPNCMVIDSADEDVKGRLVREFSSDLIRFYYGDDLIGNEVGAAAKNVVGIAAGMLDGFDLGSLKGALMSRGTRECSRLIAAMGGSELSAYGLCHLGDYEATVFSAHSHNRMFGETFVRGEAYHKLAEGCHTVKALMMLSHSLGVEMPISEAVAKTLYEGVPPRQALDALFSRDLKQEFAV